MSLMPCLIVLQIATIGFVLLYKKEAKTLKFSLVRLMAFVTVAAIICAIYRVSDGGVVVILINSLTFFVLAYVLKERQDRGVSAVVAMAAFFLVLAIGVALLPYVMPLVVHS